MVQVWFKSKTKILLLRTQVSRHHFDRLDVFNVVHFKHWSLDNYVCHIIFRNNPEKIKKL